MSSPISYPMPLSCPATVDADGRLREIISLHFDATWRLLRRLGVKASDLDDAVQEVVVVVARKLTSIAEGSERAFMLSTAYRVASTWRRTRRRRPEVLDFPSETLVDPAADPEYLLDQRRARALLDAILSELPIELRAVFVLYELERLTMAEIAQTLELAPGTVASRLRRARAFFEDRVAQLTSTNAGGSA